MPVTAQEVRDRNSSDLMAIASGRGITVESLLDDLNKERKAKITKHFAHEGRIISKREYIDWGTRQKARMDAMKLLGLYPAEKHEVANEVEILLRDCVQEAKEAAKHEG